MLWQGGGVDKEYYSRSAVCPNVTLLSVSSIEWLAEKEGERQSGYYFPPMKHLL